MNQAPACAIRRATAADAGLLAALGASTFVETFADQNTPEDMAAYLAASFGPAVQAAELADPATIYLIAEIEGAPAGYAKLALGPAPESVSGPAPVELCRLYAAGAWLGRGVGAALMEAAIGAARQAGGRTLWLGVWEHNQRARAFYARWGFREAGQHVFHLGSDAQTDLLLEKDVSAPEG